MRLRLISACLLLAALAGGAAPPPLALREAARFHADDVVIMRVQFSPAGDTLLTASGGGEAALWTLAGEPLGRFAGQRPPMFAAAFRPDGEELATTGYDGTLRLWSLRTGPFRELNLILAAVTDVAYCGEQELIAYSSDAGVGRLARLAGAGAPAQEVRGPGTARRVACHPQQRLFATVFDSGEVQVRGFSGRHSRRFLTGQRRHNAIAFSPDGRQLVTGSTDGTVKLWTAEGKPLAQFRATQSGWVNDVRFSPDGKMLALAADDGHVRLYDLAGALLLEQRVAGARVTTVAFSPDGGRLAAGTSAGEVVLYEVRHD